MRKTPEPTIPPLESTTIASWHAHTHFYAASRNAAWTLRERIATALARRVELVHFHERPVGLHPQWNTGNALRDHRDSALWIGR